MRVMSGAWLSVSTGLLVIVLAGAACDERRAATETVRPSEVAQDPSREGEPRSAEDRARRARGGGPARIATETLDPRPIRVTVESLPRPFATPSATKSPDVVAPPENARLRVPRGFAVQVFAERLPNARWIVEAPDGAVLVAQSRENRIARLVDRDRNGVAEDVSTFAGDDNGLDLPFGMAFGAGAFFLGNQDEVKRYDFRSGQARLEGEGRRIAELPGGGYRQHWTRNVVMAPEGDRLFVSVGSRSNADPEPEPRASVLVLRLDGSRPRTFASGLRNPVGLDFHPRTGALWATVNERDGLGDDLVPDYLAQIDEGEFFGWPYAYLAPSNVDPRLARDGRSARPDLAARTSTPEVLFQAHSAALGLAFYDRDRFPERYRGGAFVAFRGSWNRARGTGYEIVFVPFDEAGRARGTYEPFVTGFLVDPSGPTTWARPVGVLVHSDGSLLFTDEGNGRVYRVVYEGE